MKELTTNRKRQIKDVEPSCSTSSTNKKPSSAECFYQQFYLLTPKKTRPTTPPLYVFERNPEARSDDNDTKRDRIPSYDNIVYVTKSTDTNPPNKEREPTNQVRHQQRENSQEVLAALALGKDLSLPSHLQSPSHSNPSNEKKVDQMHSFCDSSASLLRSSTSMIQQQNTRHMHNFNMHQSMIMTHHHHQLETSPAKHHTTSRSKEKKVDTNFNAKISISSQPTHLQQEVRHHMPGTHDTINGKTSNASPESTIDEEPNDQNRMYLHATLNFPYKEFITNNDKNHIKIWNDEEEQSRLERHFNPKWQVDFLSMFYGPEGKVTYDTTVPTQNAVKNKDTKKCNQERKEVLSEDATNAKDMGDNDHDKSRFDASSSPLPIQEAAKNLNDAMDESDVTRDAIASIENEMQINRQEFLSLMTG